MSTYPPLALKQFARDFVVVEELDIELDGQGEHLWLWIEKEGLDTAWAAKCLAKAFGITVKDVSWSGRKDRHALCQQWFSLHLGSKQPTPGELPDGLRILRSQRHGRKLRVGTHKGNRFEIYLRGPCEDLSERWAQLLSQGVPNWFGEQRFGHQGGNLDKAKAWFAGEWRPKRHEQDMLLSSVRSHVFNQLLALRVADGSWQQLRLGELCLLADSQSCFLNQLEDADVNAQRCAKGDIQPSLPLIGDQGRTLPILDAWQFESQALLPFEEWRLALAKFGMQQGRRACRFWLQDPSLQQDEQGVRLSFRLTKGSYATALLQELCLYELQSTEYPTE